MHQYVPINSVLLLLILVSPHILHVSLAPILLAPLPEPSGCAHQFVLVLLFSGPSSLVFVHVCSSVS